ncbi:MAG: endonuclease domain-containing protein [Alphaproteobacteria bacterium]|nr:endonuclease domain-containing protein [Alphaproteobacteria bacterium]
MRIARRLRISATDAEQVLWKALRKRQLDGLKFRRQHPIGPYILDFMCEERRLAVELDGGQHTVEKDAARTAWLADRGIRMVRFWNNDVLSNLPGVIETIRREAGQGEEAA